MQKIKFDFEATKQLIYAPNSTAPIGAPVDADGNVANDGTAIGIVLRRRNESNKYWVKQNLVVMVAGYCDIIDAQAIWGDEYSAEAMAAMSDITFCDNHQLPTGGGGGVMVVNFTAVMGEEITLTADKTVEEVENAMATGVVYGVYTAGDGMVANGPMMHGINDENGENTIILPFVIATGANLSVIPMIMSVNGEWVALG